MDSLEIYKPLIRYVKIYGVSSFFYKISLICINMI